MPITKHKQPISLRVAAILVKMATHLARWHFTRHDAQHLEHFCNNMLESYTLIDRVNHRMYRE